MTRILLRPALAAALLLAPAARAQAPLPMVHTPSASTATLRVQDDPRRGEVVLELGPVDLPADAGHDGIAQPEMQRATLPVDGYLRGYRVEVVDADGRPVPREVLHHVNVIQPDQRELFSPIMLRLAAAGQETDPVTLPRLMGYRIRPGMPLLVTAMFHNPTGQSYRGARLRLHMPYRRAGAWPRSSSVTPFYVDVMPPASLHSYDLPPGRSEKSWEGSPAVGGRILGIGGHMHRYGTALRLEDVTAGRVIWEGRPRVDAEGEVVGMPTKKYLLRGPRVRPDHVYRLTAIYDNPTGETIPGGAMGALGGVIQADRRTPWPAVDPAHPDYQLDVHLVQHGNQMQMMGGHGGHGAKPGHEGHH